MSTRLRLGTCIALAAACALTLTSCVSMLGRGGPTKEATAKLEYVSHSEGFQGMSFSLARQGLKEIGDTVRDGYPKLVSKRAHQGAIQLGDREHLFVVDESKGTNTGFDTLYFDTDCDGELTDDKAISKDEKFRGSVAQFNDVEAQVLRGGKEGVYHVNIRFYTSRTMRAYAYAAGYNKGTLTLNGKDYAIALFDDSVNGCFNDILPFPKTTAGGRTIYASGGDTLVVDLDGDGHFHKKYDDTPEMHILGEYLCLDGECYSLTVDPDGRKLHVERVTEGCGVVELPDPNYSAQLISSKGGLKISGAKRTRVPALVYTPYRTTICKKDDKGTEWRSSAGRQWGDPGVDVQEGKVTKLTFGEPIVVEVSTRFNRSMIGMSLDIRGQAGEAYPPSGFMPDTDVRPDPPKLTVKDANDKVLHTGNFRYG